MIYVALTAFCDCVTPKPAPRDLFSSVILYVVDFATPCERWKFVQHGWHRRHTAYCARTRVFEEQGLQSRRLENSVQEKKKLFTIEPFFVCWACDVRFFFLLIFFLTQYVRALFLVRYIPRRGVGIFHRCQSAFFRVLALFPLISFVGKDD